MVPVAAAPFLTVMSYRTLTLFEIRNDNLQVTVNAKFKEAELNMKLSKLKYLKSLLSFKMKYEIPNYAAIIFFILLALLFGAIIFILDRNDTQFNFHDILVEAHGLVFDLIVFGIIITVFDFIRNRREKRSRYNEEIEDLLGWKNEEAKVKILAKVKRLYELGQRKFNLTHAYLKSADLNYYDFTNSGINFANIENGSFVRSLLKNVNLIDSNLKSVTFTNTEFINTNLIQSDCRKAIFCCSVFFEANLKNVDLRKAEFSGCDIDNSNFEGVKLSNAKVDDPNWFDYLEKHGNFGVNELKKKYYIDIESKVEEEGLITYEIKKIKTRR